jgi:hypothetical protein
MKRVLIAAVLAACFYRAPSSAMAGAGIDDLAGCRAAADGSKTSDYGLVFASGLCMGIVEGLMWSLPVAANKILCKPKGVTLEQELKVLVKYMDDHPEELQELTTQLATSAFIKAWPCPR